MRWRPARAAQATKLGAGGKREMKQGKLQEWHFRLEGYVQAESFDDAWEKANVIAAQAGYPLVVYSVALSAATPPPG